MRDLRATIGRSVTVSFVNKKGESCALVLIEDGDVWRPVGSYLVYGASKSDATFGSVHALPYSWAPTRAILDAIQRSERRYQKLRGGKLCRAR